MKHRVHLTVEVRDFLLSLAPEPRRRLKLAIKSLADERGDMRALRERLSGFYRLRVGAYRVIFRYRSSGAIECVFAKERSLVYHLFERDMLEHLRKQDGTELQVEESVAKYFTGSRKPKKFARPRHSIGGSRSGQTALRDLVARGAGVYRSGKRDLSEKRGFED